MSQSELELIGESAPLPDGVIGYMRDGRKQYSDQFRQRVAAECRESGCSVASIGLKYGVNSNLIRKWMEKYTPSGQAMLPVSLSTLPRSTKVSGPTMNEAMEPGTLAIELPGGTIRVSGAVDRVALGTVIDVLSRR